MKDILDEMVFEVTMNKNRVIEERLRVIIQPRPRWLPESIWRRILARVLYLEQS